MRSLEGIGPPLGESVYLQFDFGAPDTGGPNPISFNQVINGTIEDANETDFYSFTAPVGKEVYFNTEYGPSNFLGLDVYDSDGTKVFGRAIGLSGTAERRVLTKGGTYTIAVSFLPAQGRAGQYNFGIFDVNRQTFELSIGDTVTSGVPGPGAGEIESLGDVDEYTFMASPGEEVFFDVQSFDSDLGLAGFVVTDSDDTVVLTSSLWVTDPGPLLLTRGGTYTVRVFGNSFGKTGQYSFQVRAGTQ